MPFFNSQFDQAVEKATSEMNTTEDYQTIFEICDKIQVTPDGPKQAIRAISKRLNSNVPLHVMHALTLLDCCVKNCGRKFHLEVCSRDFESEIKKLLNKGHAKCIEKLKDMLKRWSEEEFKKNDPELSLIPSLYKSVKTENELSDNSHQRHKDSLTREKIKKEEDVDLAKAIELSLKESKATASSTLYPNASAASNPVTKTRAKESRKVRALYDFSAAEENELSFKAGEIIHIVDDSDPSWLLGSNQNGEGLFPANFVTSDLSEPIPGKVEKTVKFNDEVKVKTLETPVEEVVIDEKKIDALLASFLDAEINPTGQVPDSDDLLALEDHCLAMGPLIEQQLEKIDHQSAELSQCNKLLVDALKSYETLMKSYPSVPYAPYQVPPEVMHTYPHPSAQPQLQPQVYSTHLQHHPGEPYQPMPIPTGHEHYPVPLSGALPTTLQSRNMQAAPPQVPYDTSNLNSYGTIPHHSIPATSSNYSVPLPSRDANGLYYGDLVANSMQHSTTPISMHQPML